MFPHLSAWTASAGFWPSFLPFQLLDLALLCQFSLFSNISNIVRLCIFPHPFRRSHLVPDLLGPHSLSLCPLVPSSWLSSCPGRYLACDTLIQWFPLRALRCCSTLGSIVANKPGLSLIVFPLQVTCAFSLETFRIVSLLWGSEISLLCSGVCASVCVSVCVCFISLIFQFSLLIFSHFLCSLFLELLLGDGQLDRLELIF